MDLDKKPFLSLTCKWTSGKSPQLGLQSTAEFKSTRLLCAPSILNRSEDLEKRGDRQCHFGFLRLLLLDAKFTVSVSIAAPGYRTTVVLVPILMFSPWRQSPSFDPSTSTLGSSLLMKVSFGKNTFNSTSLPRVYWLMPQDFTGEGTEGLDHRCDKGRWVGIAPEEQSETW